MDESLTKLNSEINLDISKEQTSSIWSSEINESFLQDLEEPFDPENESISKLRCDDQYKGFNNNTGQNYIYPINFPIRSYQFNIVKAALFKNTLIVLPTGLGKTFIAAVVMYNIYRWYPTGKIIFMAPTRPLVSQQIDACCKIMGIPSDDTAEMTGKQNKNKRIELWHNKRIFFATPQVVQIDINDTDLNFPFDKIKLIVVDEAHKAKGRYAYTEVIQTINNRNPYFRIIALSATPGRRIEDVMEIIQNLCISHIEVRCENSIDVQPFTFRKNIKIILVPLGDRLIRIRDELINIIDPYVRNLIDNGVLNGSTGNFTKFWLVMEQKRFREISFQQRHPKHSILSTDFSICISLYHALELLERHGLRVFLNFFDDPENQNEKFFVQTNSKLKNFLNDLRLEVGPNPFSISDKTMTNGKIQTIPDNLDFGHPKFEMVKKYLVDNFREHKGSKVIVFCEFRESVMLLHRLLLQSRPLILPKIFVGQGGTGSIRAVSQKEQIQVMNDFRNGAINTIIATSVAEEGIDVGEVNLIICFDISSKNPTRFVQRIGRTGRRQQGQVIILATEGKEHSLVKEVLATKDKVNQKLSKSRAINHIFYKRSPRIVPPEFNPKCFEVFMKTPTEETTQPNIKKTNNKNRNKKIETDNNKKPGRKKIKEFSTSSQDVRNFFKKIDKQNNLCSIENEPLVANTIRSPNENLIDVDNNDFSVMAQFSKFNNFVEPLQKESINQISDVTINDLEPYFRKLNHLIRKTDSKTNFVNYSNIEEILLSKSVNINFKKFILQNNVDFVRQQFEAMQAMSSQCNKDCILEKDTTEKQLRLVYSRIEDILGDKNGLINFLDENKTQVINNNNELDKKFSEFFVEFEKRDFADSVQDFIAEQMKEIDLNLLELEQEKQKIQITNNCKQNTSMLYESLLENENNSFMINYEFDLDFEGGSRYASQFTHFNNRIQNQSTPINKKYSNKNDKTSINGTNNKNNQLTVQKNKISKTESFKERIENLATEASEKHLLQKVDKIISDTPTHFGLNNHNFLKKYEISADLFDDDFDDILANNNFLKSTSIKSKSLESPVNETNKIFEVIAGTEIRKPDKHNTTNPELEDFDLNDFLEPFEEEYEVEKNNLKENTSPEIIKGSISRKYSDDIFDISSPKSINKNKIEITNVVNNEKCSPKKLTNESNLISPSIFQRRSQLKHNRKHIEQLCAATIGSSQTTDSKKCDAEESIILRPRRTLKNTIESSSDSNEENIEENQVYELSQKIPITPARNRAVKRWNKRKKNQQKLRKYCGFFDNEAAHSGNDSNDESCDETDMLDSIVVLSDEEEDDPNVNMQAKYLESIRSPKHLLRGAFKIPPQRKFMDLSRIYSQPEDADDTYINCSFVVEDENNVLDNEISQMCPLEKAEAILKARRKAKRKQKELPLGTNEYKRRRIINEYREISDNESE